MRAFAVFSIVALLHFALSIAGILVALPAAFDTQSGFWAAPGKALLAWTAAVLLAPLDWLSPLLPQREGLGYAEIAVVSVLFGVAAVAIDRAWRAWRSRRRA